MTTPTTREMIEVLANGYWVDTCATMEQAEHSAYRVAREGRNGSIYRNNVLVATYYHESGSEPVTRYAAVH